MRTDGVRKLVGTVLSNLPKPYSEDVIDEVFEEIQNGAELMAEYERLCKELGKTTVNTWGGYWIANAVGKSGLTQVPARKSRLIQTYSRLTETAASPGKKRKEAEALQLMSDYYQENKGTLPAYIRNHREDIVEMIIEGLPVEQVFAMQIDCSPPPVPVARRR